MSVEVTTHQFRCPLFTTDEISVLAGLKAVINFEGELPPGLPTDSIVSQQHSYVFTNHYLPELQPVNISISLPTKYANFITPVVNAMPIHPGDTFTAVDEDERTPVRLSFS